MFNLVRLDSISPVNSSLFIQYTLFPIISSVFSSMSVFIYSSITLIVFIVATEYLKEESVSTSAFPILILFSKAGFLEHSIFINY